MVENAVLGYLGIVTHHPHSIILQVLLCHMLSTYVVRINLRLMETETIRCYSHKSWEIRPLRIGICLTGFYPWTMRNPACLVHHFKGSENSAKNGRRSTSSNFRNLAGWSPIPHHVHFGSCDPLQRIQQIQRIQILEAPGNPRSGRRLSLPR